MKKRIDNSPKISPKLAKDREIKKSNKSPPSKNSKSTNGGNEFGGLMLIGVILVVVMFIVGIVMAVILKKPQQQEQEHQDSQAKNGFHITYYGKHGILKTSIGPEGKQITLNTPAEEIEPLKYIVVKIEEGIFNGGEFEIEISSYFQSPGENLVFFGTTHLVSLSADGILELEPLTPTEKEAIPIPSQDIDDLITRTTDKMVMDLSSLKLYIANCKDLSSMQDEKGHYVLKNNLTCTLEDRLLAGKIFEGIFDGQGHTLTVDMDIPMPIALFARIKGTIKNLILEGSIKGSAACGGFAIFAYGGSVFEKCTSNVRIQCEAGEELVKAGGFVGAINVIAKDTVKTVKFIKCTSQGSIEIDHANRSALIGGFYGQINSGNSVFVDCFVDANYSFIKQAPTQKSSLFGFLSNSQPECPKGVSCIVDNGAELDNDCCSKTERSVYPNFFVTK